MFMIDMSTIRDGVATMDTTTQFQLGLNSFSEVASDAGRTSSLFVGSPETVAAKIARVARANHLSQFDFKYALVNMPAAYRQHTIRLFGTEVAPRVRELLAAEPADPWRFEGRPVVEITPGHEAVHA